MSVVVAVARHTSVLSRSCQCVLSVALSYSSRPEFTAISSSVRTRKCSLVKAMMLFLLLGETVATRGSDQSYVRTRVKVSCDWPAAGGRASRLYVSPASRHWTFSGHWGGLKNPLTSAGSYLGIEEFPLLATTVNGELPDFTIRMDFQYVLPRSRIASVRGGVPTPGSSLELDQRSWCGSVRLVLIGSGKRSSHQ